MKDFCAMVLSVVQSLAVSGRRPRRDVVLAFVLARRTAASSVRTG
jgi:hypothetical protein